jgi:4-amino-4-deoxy-L-arabinose transferase-like glycosyltransferase
VTEVSGQPGVLGGRPAGPVEGLRDLWNRTSPWISTRWAALALFLVATAAYWLEAIGWPVVRGRDAWDYLSYFLELPYGDPLFPALMVFRTPVTPIVLGAPLVAGGVVLLEIVLGVMFAASVVAWSAVAHTCGRVPALVTAVVLLVYPGYATLFHEASSDPVFACGFALWSLLAVRTVRRPSAWRFAAVGAGVGILVLTRPPNIVLLLAVLLPLLARGRWLLRLAWAGAFLAGAAVLLGGWVVNNAVRYDDTTLVRGGSAFALFERLYRAGEIKEENGPASRRLGAAIRRDILSRPAYRKLGLTVDDYLKAGSQYEFVNILQLSDRVFGWGNEYAVLGNAASEALSHGAEHGGGGRSGFLHRIGRAFWRLLQVRPLREVSEQLPPVSSESPPLPRWIVNGVVMPNPETLPPSSAPLTYGWFWCSSEWIERCTVKDPGLVWRDPGQQHRYRALVRRITNWTHDLPPRDGSSWVAARLKGITFHFPRAIFWIAVAAIALVLRRPRRTLPLIAVAVLALLVLGVHAVSQGFLPEYALPVYPAFITLAIAALFGERRRAAT